MKDGLYTVDFHTHLQDGNTQLNCCAEDRKTAFFASAQPIFDKIASLSEPVHDRFIRFWALNHRDHVSRYFYARLGSIGLMEVLRLFKTYDIGKMINRMDRNGVDHSVIHSIEPLTSTANIIKLTEPYRERVSVFASVDKNEADPAGYLRQFVDSGIVSGIKIHPIVGGFQCGELLFRMSCVVELAIEHDLPIMIHTGHIPTGSLKGLGGCTEIQGLEPLVKAYPEAKIILAHIGWESWRQTLDLASRYPNTYVETSWQPARIIRRAVDTLGSRRVLFGSDFPLFKQSMALRNVRAALTGREFVDVVSVNATRLLKLSPTKQSSDSKAGPSVLRPAH